MRWTSLLFLRSRSLFLLSILMFALGQFIFLSEYIKPAFQQLPLDFLEQRSAHLPKIPVDAKLSILYISVALASLACIGFNLLSPPAVRRVNDLQSLREIIQFEVAQRDQSHTGLQVINRNIGLFRRSKVTRTHRAMCEQLETSAGSPDVIKAQQAKIIDFLSSEIDKSYFQAPLVSIFIGVSIILTSAISLYEIARVLEYVIEILF